MKDSRKGKNIEKNEKECMEKGEQCEKKKERGNIENMPEKMKSRRERLKQVNTGKERKEARNSNKIQ